MIFRKGERVMFIGYDENFPDKAVGTIIHVNGKSIAVDWDERLGCGHTCQGNCRNGHGYYVIDDELEREHINWRDEL